MAKPSPKKPARTRQPPTPPRVLTPRQAARTKELLRELDGYLERLSAFDKRKLNTLSGEDEKSLKEWQCEADKIVLQLARRGVNHPYVTRRLSNLRALGDKDFLRKAHLEAGVQRPIPPGDLALWDRIDRLLQGGASSWEAIRKALIAEGWWKGKRQAFDKLLRRLGFKGHIRVAVRKHTPRDIDLKGKTVLLIRSAIVKGKTVPRVAPSRPPQ